MTQEDGVLALLQDRGSRGVTPLEALDLVGTFRLAAHIHRLRQAGWAITTHTMETPGGAHVARYVLESEPVQLSWTADA
jgi:hypothetical protein